MAASYSDKYILSTDPTFGNRVMQSMLAYCGVIGSEGFGVAFHRERQKFVTLVLGNPLFYKNLFAPVVADDTSVIADATQAGTVVLTGANVAAQAALVTDGHIDNSIASTFNNFFLTPGS